MKDISSDVVKKIVGRDRVDAMANQEMNRCLRLRATGKISSALEGPVSIVKQLCGRHHIHVSSLVDMCDRLPL